MEQFASTCVMLRLYFTFKSQLECDQPQYLQPRDMIKPI